MSGYVTLNNINLFQEYGMRLTSFFIGNPSPIIKLIDVPGRPGKLDATLALNGKVNLSTRKVSATFHIRDSNYNDWHTLISTLNRAFNGTESKMIFSTDPDWYYKGRFIVESKKSNPITTSITISCNDTFPYKLEYVEEMKTVNSSLDVICVGKEYNSSIVIITSSSMTVTFNEKTYQLSAGENKMREIYFSEGNNTLSFNGTGTVTISYERGVQ